MRTVILIAFALATLPSHAQTPPAPSVWDTTRLHYLQQPITKLNPPDRHEILKRLQIPASQLRGEEVTLDGDRTFLVQAQPGLNSRFCGNINCEFWIFDANHKILLETDAESVGYLPAVHHGRNDVLVARHNSSVEQGVGRWQFDGTRYHRVQCVDVTYGDFDGKVYRPPHIKPTPCESM